MSCAWMVFGPRIFPRTTFLLCSGSSWCADLSLIEFPILSPPYSWSPSCWTLCNWCLSYCLPTNLLLCCFQSQLISNLQSIFSANQAFFGLLHRRPKYACLDPLKKHTWICEIRNLQREPGLKLPWQQAWTSSRADRSSSRSSKSWRHHSHSYRSRRWTISAWAYIIYCP